MLNKKSFKGIWMRRQLKKTNKKTFSKELEDISKKDFELEDI